VSSSECASCRGFMEWPRLCPVCSDEVCERCFGVNGACEDCEESGIDVQMPPLTRPDGSPIESQADADEDARERAADADEVGGL